MKKPLSIILLICILITGSCFLFVGCKPKDPNTIRLTEVTHSVFYAPFYVALNNGSFSDQGLKIELTNGGGADNCMTALIANKSDIGLMGPEAAIYVYNEGREDYPVIFAQLTKKDGSFLMARKPMENFSWKDIENKEVIGGRPGGVPALTLEYALRKNNLIDGKNLTINYDVKYDLIGASFESGVGDFCTMFEPAASNMQAAGKGYIVGSVGQEAEDMPYTAFMATKSYIKNNRKQVDAFTKALIGGIEFVKTHTAREIADVILPSFVGTPVEVLEKAIQSYKNIDAYCYSPMMLQSDFEHLQDIIINAGIMTKRADFSKLIDNSIASALIKK